MPAAAGGRLSVAVLAVSGGPDSLALMLVAAQNRSAFEAAGIGFHVVTVDHGLRSGSAGEAAGVARTAASLGLGHSTRRWEGPKPVANIAAAARRARYRLLGEAARDLGAEAIVTAHHQDDQIETHFLAAARRAGDRGLAGMRARRELQPGLVLLRPFLDVPGAVLKALVAGRGLAAVDDPGNRDPRFERARLRLELASAGLDRDAVLERIEAHRLGRDEGDRRLAQAIAVMAEQGELAIGEDGVLEFGRAALRSLDHRTAFDFLARALGAAGGAEHPPVASAIERLLAGIADGPREFKATLGGAVVAAGERVAIFREYGRTGIPDVPVSTALRFATFDGRFDIVLGDDARPADARLAALGALGRGNATQRTLPVLLDEAGAVLAAHPSLLERLGSDARPLVAKERVSWRFRADLPAGESRPPAA